MNILLDYTCVLSNLSLGDHLFAFRVHELTIFVLFQALEHAFGIGFRAETLKQQDASYPTIMCKLFKSVVSNLMIHCKLYKETIFMNGPLTRIICLHTLMSWKSSSGSIISVSCSLKIFWWQRELRCPLLSFRHSITCRHKTKHGIGKLMQ